MTKLLTTILIILSTNLFAQEQLAKDILDKLSATTKSYKNITVGFNFIFENKSQNINEIQKGILVLQEEMFRLEMAEQIIINNGESQWIYLSDINEVQIMDNDPEEDIMSPNKLFSIYEKGYNYNYIGTDSENGKRLEIIDLFPIKSGAFIKVTLAIDAAKNQLHKITIFDKNGGTYSYLVNTFKSNTIVSPFTFNTDEYKGVEIIDLR